MSDVSVFRLNLLRLMYLLNLALLGSDVWPVLLHPPESFSHVSGVAYSFWGALSLLSLVGIRYPLKMLPLLFMQLAYKIIWLAAVALPLRAAGTLSGGAEEMAWVFLIGGVLDIVVIPWPYVWATFVRAPGERWRR